MAGQQVKCVNLAVLDGYFKSPFSIAIRESNSYITLKSHLVSPLTSSDSEVFNNRLLFVIGHSLFDVAMGNLPECIF